MMTRFHVKNYKCLANIDIPLTPIHVLVGENNAGKTSLLEAIYALHRTSEYTVAGAFPGRWTGRDLVFETSPTNEVFLGAVWKLPGKESFSYQLQIDFSSQNRQLCSLLEEGVYTCSNFETLPQIGNTQTLVPYRRDGAKVPDTVVDAVDTIESVLTNAHMYRLDPKLMAVPCELSSKRKFRLDPDGFGLAGLLDDILGYDLDQFASIRDAFCNYFPQFRSVRIETEQAVHRDYQESGIHSSGEVAGKGIYLETQSGNSIRAQQASDGVILFLGFLALAHLPDPPKLLLIEEPENGIYPKRLEELIQILKKFVIENESGTAPQIIMTTHSPYVLSFFEPEEVTFMSRQDASSVRARPLRAAPHIRERMDGGTFNLGELWYNLTEKELFGDE